MAESADRALFRRALDEFEKRVRADENYTATRDSSGRDPLEQELRLAKYRKARARITGLVKMFIEAANA